VNAEGAPPHAARRALRVIVVAQFMGTSLWFSVNGVGDDLAAAWGLDAPGLGALTSAVQAGFIVGTLLIALTGFADRHPASRIFAVAALLACLLHPGALWAANWPSGPTVQRAADGTFDALILRPTALMVLATGAGLFVPAAVVSAPSGCKPSNDSAPACEHGYSTVSGRDD